MEEKLTNFQFFLKTLEPLIRKAIDATGNVENVQKAFNDAQEEIFNKLFFEYYK